MSAKSSPRTPVLKIVSGLAAICAAAGALAGCGGSSVSHTQTQVAHPTPIQSAPDVGTANVQRASRHAHSAAAQASATAPAKASAPRGIPATTAGGTVIGPGQASRVVKAHATPASAAEQRTRSAMANTFNPCKLVSLREAQSITGGAVAASHEAPLGPTCIYSGKGSQPITMAIESLNFSQVSRQMAQRRAIVLHGRTSYCGHLGASMLFVPLPAGEVLNVTAPCNVAQQFASLALSRLAA